MELPKFNRRTRRLIERNKKKYAHTLLKKHKQGIAEIDKMIKEVGTEKVVDYLSNRIKELRK